MGTPAQSEQTEPPIRAWWNSRFVVPGLMLLSTIPASNGITAQAISDSVKVSIGAITNTTRLAPDGRMVSLKTSLMPSAIG